MIVGNRSLRIIVLSLIVFLLAINFALWNFDSYLASSVVPVDFNFYSWHNDNWSYDFKGFKWFFDRIASFPGIENTRDYLNGIFKIISGYKVDTSQISAWDVVGAIIDLFLGPILLFYTIAADLVSNIIWFFSFFWN